MQTIASVYTALPFGCTCKLVGKTNYCQCAGFRLEPAFGVNGVFCRAVPAP